MADELEQAVRKLIEGLEEIEPARLDALHQRLQSRTLPGGSDTAKTRSLPGPAEVLLLDAFVNEGVVDVDAVANAFGLSKSQLAETLGISREAFYKRARVEAPKTQARLREMLEILGRILDWAGTKEHAMAWYRSQPVPALGGRTAESMVKSGEATVVRDYLDHIAVGGYA